jgi:hypothetical protein
VNHRGERAVFYSTRHGHGTALADVGVAEKGIASSMHHSSRAVTARYLHTDQRARQTAIEAMPDFSYSVPQAATGTDSRPVDPAQTRTESDNRLRRQKRFSGDWWSSRT